MVSWVDSICQSQHGILPALPTTLDGKLLNRNKFLLSLASIWLLAGCGLKGDLYLPQSVDSKQSTESTQIDNDAATDAAIETEANMPTTITKNNSHR